MVCSGGKVCGNGGKIPKVYHCDDTAEFLRKDHGTDTIGSPRCRYAGR